MAKKTYIGVNNVAREVKKMYIGVNGIAKKVTKAYIGDENGKAKLVYSAEVRYNITYLNSRYWDEYPSNYTPIDPTFLKQYLPFLPTSAPAGEYISYYEIFEQNGFSSNTPYSWYPLESTPLYESTEEIGIFQGEGIYDDPLDSESTASGFTMPNNDITIFLFGVPDEVNPSTYYANWVDRHPQYKFTIAPIDNVIVTSWEYPGYSIYGSVETVGTPRHAPRVIVTGQSSGTVYFDDNIGDTNNFSFIMPNENVTISLQEV